MNLFSPDTASTGPWLTGIVPPLVTPLTQRDRLDLDGTERLLNRVIDGGVAGVFILGTTGEAPSLSYRLRREMITRTCQLVDRRVPVLVGITDTAFVESLHLAEVAAEAGATAAVLATPYYFPAGQTELIQYIHHVVSELPLPLMLYNMPSLTKVWFEIESLREFVDLPQVVGVKDSSGDLAYFHKLLQYKSARPDWSVLIGPEHLLQESLRLGGDGGVNGGANIYPELFVGLYEAYRSGDNAQVAALQQDIEQLQQIYSIGKYGSRFIKATKCALSLKDVCHDHMAEPFNHFLPPERQRVAQLLHEFDNGRRQRP